MLAMLVLIQVMRFIPIRDVILALIGWINVSIVVIIPPVLGVRLGLSWLMGAVSLALS